MYTAMHVIMTRRGGDEEDDDDIFSALNPRSVKSAPFRVQY